MRLRELRIFSMEKRRPKADLTNVHIYLIRFVQNTKPDFSQWYSLTGPEALHTI